MSLDVFPMYLHCIRSLRFFESCCFFSHTNRHLLSTSVTCHARGFPMFLHCIRSLHFLKDVSDFFFLFSSAVTTCLRSLHVMGCFSYVSVLYTFVTFF